MKTPAPNNDNAAGGGDLTKVPAAKESKATWTPAMMAEHKSMMSGVPEGTKPQAPGADKGWEERSAYRKAFEEHVGNFLSGTLKNDKGEVVQHREEALTHAHVNGLKAVQALKKTGLKMRVFAD